MSPPPTHTTTLSKALDIRTTPVVVVRLLVRGRPRELWLKLEGYGGHGSLKGRTAQALWADVADCTDPDAGLIESTSGNLGVALAAVAAANRIPFTAVMDPRSSASYVEFVRAYGARVVLIDTPDGAGGYLLNRLLYVEQRLREDPRLVWPNQYRNPAAPRVHCETTAPELWEQTGGRPMTVAVAVSTGGTLAGFRDFVRLQGPAWELVGVDVEGSAALGGPGGCRVLAGVGASRRSAFLPHGHHPARLIGPAPAVEACLWLSRIAGLAVGASTGVLVAAALQLFRESADRDAIACVCPDGAAGYRDTVYSRRWRADHGLHVAGLFQGVELLDVQRARLRPAVLR